MPLGYANDLPDDHQFHPLSSRSPVQDLGEAVTRLGAVQTLDRRGEMLWCDVGDRGFSPYFMTVSGDGGEYYLSSIFGTYGAYGIILVGGSTSNHYIFMQHPMMILNTVRLGFETMVYIPNAYEKLYLTMYSYDGTYRYYGGARLVYDDNVLQIVDETLSWTTIYSLPSAYKAAYTYHALKMVIDLETKKYHKIIWNDQEISLSDYTLSTSASSTPPKYNFGIALYSRSGYNDMCAVHYQIVTANDP